jgi:hypothetical protein
MPVCHSSSYDNSQAWEQIMSRGNQFNYLGAARQLNFTFAFARTQPVPVNFEVGRSLALRAVGSFKVWYLSKVKQLLPTI